MRRLRTLPRRALVGTVAGLALSAIVMQALVAHAAPITGTSTINTYAGTGASGYNGDNIPATTATLSEPVAATVDSAGNLYIADTNNNRIREVIASTRTITTVAGTGAACDTTGYSSDPTLCGDNGPPTSAKLNAPQGVAVDSGNRLLFIADTTDLAVRVVNLTTQTINHFASVTTGPVGIAVYPGAGVGSGGAFVGAVFYDDQFLNQVFRATYDSDGNLVDATLILDNSNGLNQPAGLTVDTAGTLYIANSGSSNILRVPAAATCATTPSNTCQATTTVLASGLNNPYGVAADPNNPGSVFVADTGNALVREAAPDGSLSTIAGGGSGCTANMTPPYDRCQANESLLSLPAGVAVDSTGGNLFIVDQGSDTNGERVRVVGALAQADVDATSTAQAAASQTAGAGTAAAQTAAAGTAAAQTAAAGNAAQTAAAQTAAADSAAQTAAAQTAATDSAQQTAVAGTAAAQTAQANAAQQTAAAGTAAAQTAVAQSAAQTAAAQTAAAANAAATEAANQTKVASETAAQQTAAAQTAEAASVQQTAAAGTASAQTAEADSAQQTAAARTAAAQTAQAASDAQTAAADSAAQTAAAQTAAAANAAATEAANQTKVASETAAQQTAAARTAEAASAQQTAAAGTAAAQTAEAADAAQTAAASTAAAQTADAANAAATEAANAAATAAAAAAAAAGTADAQTAVAGTASAQTAQAASDAQTAAAGTAAAQTAQAASDAQTAAADSAAQTAAAQTAAAANAAATEAANQTKVAGETAAQQTAAAQTAEAASVQQTTAAGTASAQTAAAGTAQAGGGIIPVTGGTATPELGSGELIVAGLVPILAILLYRRRRALQQIVEEADQLEDEPR